MEAKVLSNKTFSNNSFDNWISKKCDFCLHHELIFAQLQRVKQALLIKNQRIQELQEFIARISSLAFLKSPHMSTANALTSILSSNINQSSIDFQNESSAHFQKGNSPSYLKKKFEQSSEISFSQSKQNPGKFQIKLKQNIPELSEKFQKIYSLNQIKKKSHQINHNYQKNIWKPHEDENHNYFQKFQTLKSLSQPQQQGQINSLQIQSCQKSRVIMNKFQSSLANEQTQKIVFTRSHSKQQIKSDESPLSLSIVKEFLKKLH